MESLLDIWNVAKPILEVGVVGALLVLMLRREGEKDRQLRDLMEIRVKDERSHGKEVLRVQREHHDEMKALLTQYDETLASVESTLESVVEAAHGEESGDD